MVKAGKLFDKPLLNLISNESFYNTGNTGSWFKKIEGRGNRNCGMERKKRINTA
jgi:hypothetical protein